MELFKSRNNVSQGVLGVLFVLVAITALITNSNKYPEAYYGKPTVSIDYPNLHKSSVEQVLVDENHMYILPHHSNGIIQVCDINGEYEHTMFFYENINGSFAMDMVDDVLYVRDNKRNVYVFRDGVFDCFMKKSEAEMLSYVDFRSGESSPGYEIRGSSIWKITDSGEECIVAETQGNGFLKDLMMVMFCVVLVIIMVQETRKRK